MTAGPTPVPPAVSQAMAAPMLYHRAPAFVELYERVLGKLPYVFQTENPVLAFAASGSGAMESAAANLVRPGAPVLACAAGKFGERWIELRRRLRRRDRALRAGLGRAPRPGRDRPPADRERRHRGRLRHAQRDLDRHRPRRAAIAEVARAHDAILAVDAVSGLGAAELRQDEWGIDVVVAGSQKALMCPPGLAFASVSERALEYAAEQAGRPLLLRLGQERQGPGQGQQRLHARRAAVPRPRHRARHDPRGGPRGRARPPRAAGPRHARRRRGDRPRASTATPTSARPSSPPSSCRTRSTAPRSPARCASSASPPTAARSSSRAASSGSPTAATSAPSTS